MKKKKTEKRTKMIDEVAAKMAIISQRIKNGKKSEVRNREKSE